MEDNVAFIISFPQEVLGRRVWGLAPLRNSNG